MLIGLGLNVTDVSLKGGTVMLPVQRTCEVANGDNGLRSKAMIINSFGTTKDEVLEKRDEELGQVLTSHFLLLVSSLKDMQGL